MKTGRFSVIHCWLGVWAYWGSLWGQTCCSV